MLIGKMIDVYIFIRDKIKQRTYEKTKKDSLEKRKIRSQINLVVGMVIIVILALLFEPTN